MNSMITSLWLSGIAGGYLVGTTARTQARSGFRELVEQMHTGQTNAYRRSLESRFGVQVTVESIGRDRESLDAVGKRMSGSDVIIAPNILEEMANDLATAAYYERKIQDFFNDIPRQQALCAAKGLVYEPGGVVIHEDGSVTYISGCSDSPERMAQVAAENREKQEKRAAMREASLERSLESAELLRQLREDAWWEQIIFSMSSMLSPQTIRALYDANLTGM